MLPTPRSKGKVSSLGWTYEGGGLPASGPQACHHQEAFCGSLSPSSACEPPCPASTHGRGRGCFLLTLHHVPRGIGGVLSRFDAHPKSSKSLRAGVRAGGRETVTWGSSPSPEGPREPCQEALAPERMTGRGGGVGPWRRESLREADPEWRGPDAQGQPCHGIPTGAPNPATPKSPRSFPGDKCRLQTSARPLGYQCPICTKRLWPSFPNSPSWG